jgi:2-polyprenyl-3-methyl-5-hydroxy-6-metoxy-1,4-benzoquinol methylase
MKILDLGCGKNKIKKEGAIVIGVDIDSTSGADVIHDLNKFPYPFKDNEFDEIICFDILEHLQDIPSVMKELHRIGKNGALVKIRSPHFSSPYASLDPTHLRGFSIFSFDCFCKNKKIIPHNINWELFLIKKRKIIFPKLTRTVGILIDFLANKFPLRYEQYFTFLFQAENIYLELEIIK